MPCRDDGPRDESAFERLDKVTRMLCRLLENCESSVAGRAIIQGASKELNDWWCEHKAIDARRKAAELEAREAEKARAKALAKLTPAERRLLGLR